MEIHISRTFNLNLNGDAEYILTVGGHFVTTFTAPADSLRAALLDGALALEDIPSKHFQSKILA